MNYIFLTSQIVSYIRKNSPQNTRSSWVKWRGLVNQIHEFDFDPTKIKYFINNGKSTFKSNLTSVNHIAKAILDLPETKQVSALNLVKLYLSIENRNKERLNISYQNEFWSSLCSELDLPEKAIKNIDSQSIKWFEQEEDKSFFTPINISATLLLVILDFALRWVSLWIYKTEQLESWFGITDGAEGWFYSGQFLIIPIIIISFSVIRRNWVNKKTAKLFEELNLKKFKLQIKNNAWNFALVFVFAFMGEFIHLSIYNDIPTILVLILIVLLIGYYIFLLNNFSIRYPHPKEVIAQLETLKSTTIRSDLSYEENDVEIINLEVKLRSLNEQMDAFVLEAALFGALAFSGFLSIISSDIFAIEGVSSFSHNMNALLTSFVNFDVSGNGEILKAIMSKEGLLSLLSYQTLFCSIFFLSVIASRLKFNDLTDDVDRSLQLSRNFNEREEDLIKNDKLESNKSQIEVLTQKIRTQLRFGALKYHEIEPIMVYMKFFRTLGISTFFIIIITGGLFVSFEIALILMFISLLSIVYFKIGVVKDKLNSYSMALQEFYFVIDKYVHYISWSFVAVALVLRSFHLFIGDVFMFIGFTLLFLHYIISLVVPENIDEVDKEQGFKSTISIRQLLNRLLKIGFSLFLLGYMFKTMHWPGAGPSIVFGSLMLAIYYFFQPKNSGLFWINSLLSITMGWWFITYTFQMQHYPRRDEALILASALLGVSLILVIWKRKFIDKAVKKAYFIMVAFTVILSFGYGQFVLSRLSFNYSDYENGIEFLSLDENIYLSRDLGGFFDAKTNAELDSLNASVKKMTVLLIENKQKLSSNDRYSKLWGLAFYAIGDSINPIIVNEALIWINEASSIEEQSENYEIKTKLLIKLERWQEAKTAALKNKSVYIKEEREEIDTDYLQEIDDRLEWINNELEKQNANPIKIKIDSTNTLE